LPTASVVEDPSVLRRIWYSLLGGPIYRLLATRSQRAYPAFVLVAVATAAISAGVAGWTAQRGLAAIVAVWSGLPAFVISDGHLVLPAGIHSPVRLAAGGAVILLEDQLQPQEDALGQAAAGIVVTADDLVLRLGQLPGGDKEIPLTDLGDTPLTKAGLGSFISEFAGPGVWLGAVLTVAYDVLRDVVRAAIVAWLGFGIARMAGRSTTWAQAWRIGLAAWTLSLLAEVGNVATTVPGWALWLVAAVYAFTGCLQFPALE